ncbi:MAG: glycosyltransferase family 2 protein [Bacteroidales bacterium]|nr:glycosyltransferase family 2 protein [Bacteroidales bacterium]
MKKVLVILVTHNGMHWLPRCLASVAPSGNNAISPDGQVLTDVYVVDNDSTDGSADWIQANYSSVKLVRSADNLGFTKANNLGMDWAVSHGYDYVYLLNQDAWLEEGTIDKLVAAAEAHQEYAVLSPLQMTDGFKELDRLFKKDKTPPAAHWLMRVDAIKQVGKFSELFPYYGQDDDWCNRARYHGWTIGIVPQARAVHDRAQRKESKERVIDRNYRVGSLIRLCDINHPLWERFLFVCLFTLVKAVKYFSFKPFVHFWGICKKLPDLVYLRDLSKKEYGSFRHT